MGISLNGLTPAGTYPGLIKTGDNTAISGTPKVLSDGNGNNLPMEVSTAGVNFTNNLTQGGTALQPVLVSGTNIKTINGTSVLGSGNIVTPSTPPSGVAGAIQFSNGSAFASDAANLFWDDTNNRLGIGTNAPRETLDVNGQIRTRTTTGVNIFGAGSVGLNDAHIFLNQSQGAEISYGGNGFSAVGGYNIIGGNTTIGSTVFRNGDINLGVRLGVRGNGSTSATTSLLVQNSAGTTSLQVTDDGVIQGNSGTQLRYRFGGASPMGVSTRNGAFTIGMIDGGFNQGMQFNVNSSSGKGYIDGWATFDLVIGNNGNPVQIGTDSSVASAQLTVNSTTKGFMPPRMTTTQRDNIVGVAAGLIIYNSVTNKLQCYNGSTWNDLF
jgi:hypothetical protein